MIWLNGEEYNGEWKSNLQVLYMYILYALEQKLMQISLHYRDASLTKTISELVCTLVSSFFALFLPPPTKMRRYIGYTYSI